MITTIETRLRLDATQESEIDSCVALWSQYYRKTWRLWNNHHLPEKELYHQLMASNCLTSEQAGSLINKVKTEHAKIRELSKSQLKQQKAKLDNINKFIVKENRTIAQYNKALSQLKLAKPLNYAKIAQLTQSIHKKQQVLKQKNIRVIRLNQRIAVIQERINRNTFKLCFGSSALLKKRPGSYQDKFRINKQQQVYSSLIDWKKDWELSRNNIWYAVGRSNKPQGNAEIQYYPEDKRLRLRVTEETYLHRLSLISKETGIDLSELKDKQKYSPYRMKARFIIMDNVAFCTKNQVKLTQAMSNKQPVSAKIIKKLTPNGKDLGFYLQLSFEEVVQASTKKTLVKPTMGIDLNQKGLAYCLVKPDGNKLSTKDLHSSLNHKPNGFIQWDLENKTQAQRQWLISNAITDVLTIAQAYGVYHIAIENLDFSNTLNSMNSGYKSNQKYNHMLTQFAKSLFHDLIKRKTERLNLKLYLVNPSYSSIGGFAKYGLINKIKVDIAASLWLARQAIYGQSYKKEAHVEFIKKHNEEVTIPYLNLSKQSKRENSIKLEWKEISSALGKNRNLWYQNTMSFIQSKVAQSRSIQINPFELNQS